MPLSLTWPHSISILIQLIFNTMKLTIFVLFFPFLLSPVSSITQANVARDVPGQVADSTTKQGFFYRLAREMAPTEEQLNKELIVKSVFTVIVIIAAILVAFHEDRKMKKFYNNNK